MGDRIRAIEARDVNAVAALSLRAWAPVFDSMRVWVGVDDDDRPVGFVAVAQQDEGTAAIDMLAVDPSARRTGLGAALTAHAIDWMRDHQITLAIVETGGDPGHAPARRTYEAAGFTQMPIARYFMVLE